MTLALRVRDQNRGRGSLIERGLVRVREPRKRPRPSPPPPKGPFRSVRINAKGLLTLVKTHASFLVSEGKIRPKEKPYFRLCSSTEKAGQGLSPPV